MRTQYLDLVSSFFTPLRRNVVLKVALAVLVFVCAATVTYVSASSFRQTQENGLGFGAAPVLTVTSSIASFTINPASVMGGKSTVGTVTLSAPAPKGGKFVSVSSNNGAVSNTSLFIPRGQSEASFNIKTLNVVTEVAATLKLDSADSGGSGATAQASTLRVTPRGVALASINVSPTSVVGGVQSLGSVNLVNPAPLGGSTVLLSSSNSALAGVPSNVTIPAGNSSATFVVNTGAVNSIANISISGVYAGRVLSAPLTIQVTMIPTVLSSLSVNPGSLTGGGNSQATVTLSQAAPSGGAVVTLSSDTPSVASVPANVTVAAGSSSANITVPTSIVASSTTLVLSGSCGGVSRSAAMTVNPAAVTASSLALNPTTLVGGSASQCTVTLSGIAPAGGAVVSLSSNNTGVATVPATVTVAAGVATATFSVSTVGVAAATNVSISGSYGGVSRSASLAVNPPAVTASSLALNPTSLVGGSTAQGTVTLSGAAPSGGGVVSLSSNNTAVATVPATVTVAAGVTTATFTVTSVSVASATNVSISGSYGGVSRSVSLAVNPPAVTASSLALNPTSLVGGSTSQGTVTLSAAAPSGGAVVSLSSNNTAVATVPATVTVAAGVTTATFTVTSVSVASVTNVSISGSYGGVSRSASLAVNPPAVTASSLALNPTSLVGGSTSQGTVTLSGAAPSGGGVVSLSSNNTAVATVPATVTVAAGVTTATFTVTSVSVASATNVSISGSYGGVSRSVSLAVNPPAVTASSLALNPTSLVGGSTSQGTVTLSAAAPAGGAVVSLSSNNTGAATVPATVTVAAGVATATFTVSTVSVAAVTNVSISGSYGSVSRSASLAVNPPPVTASSLALNPTTLVGGSTSQGTVTLSAAAPAGGAVVSLSSNNTVVATVPATITVAAGVTTATFSVSTVSVAATTNVSISGSYGGVSRSASLAVNPPPVTMSSVTLIPTGLVGASTAQGTVTLSGAAPSGGALVSLSSNNTSAATVPASVTVAAGATSATFTIGTSTVSSVTGVSISGSYGGVSRSASLTVNPPPPVTLSSLTLNPTSVTGGSVSQGTVTLSGAAPAGGAVVTLSSTIPAAASVPPSVTVPAGSSSANFNVTTSTVVNNTSATISGAYSGATSGSSLTVQPPVPCPGFVIEGFGQNTTGGCGGTVYFVTSLANSGAGTLREYLENRTGPRIIKFAVSGDIRLTSDLSARGATGNPYGNVTIDGSDAPNGGICIRGQYTVFVSAINAIVRNIRFRQDPPRIGQGCVNVICNNGFCPSNVVFDHCSVTWGQDGNLDVANGASNVTIQWCIISENSASGTTLIRYNNATRITIHHCLFANNSSNRNSGCYIGDVQSVNNVIYRNFTDTPSGFENLIAVAPDGPGEDGGTTGDTLATRASYVGNYFRAGSNEPSGGNHREIYLYGARSGAPISSVYLSGNMSPARPNNGMAENALIEQQDSPSLLTINNGPFSGFPSVTTTSAAQALIDVLAGAGARLPCQDAADSRIVTYVNNSTGGGLQNVGNDPSTVGGWPDLTRPCGSGARLAVPSSIDTVLPGVNALASTTLGGANAPMTANEARAFDLGRGMSGKKKPYSKPRVPVRRLKARERNDRNIAVELHLPSKQLPVRM